MSQEIFHQTIFLQLNRTAQQNLISFQNTATCFGP